ncbi:hypothetical protein ACG95P_09625 [Acinetobacter guillouiae]
MEFSNYIIYVNEILSRQIKEASKPHWTITPTLIVATIAAVASVLALLK